MDIREFKKRVRNLLPGRTLIYHVGNLMADRINDANLNKVASFALAVDDCGTGAVFQRRLPDGKIQYELRVFKRLGMRRDENGSFQEAERVASLHESRIMLS